MSGLASSGPKSPRKSPSGVFAGPGEPPVAGAGDADAEVGAVARHDGDDGRARDALGRAGGQLAGRHPEVEEEVLVGAGEAHGLGDVGRRRVGGDQAGQQLAQQHERAGAVAVVPLVAHLQHLGDDRADVDRAGRADRLRQDRAEHPGHPAQPLDDLGAVGAVAQHLAQALVERAPRLVAVHVVAQRVDPHRRADDTRPSVRPRRGGGTARGRTRLRRGASRPPRRCRPAPRRAPPRSGRRASGPTRAPTRAAGRRAGRCPARGPSASEAGPTSTSTASAAVIRSNARALAAARRGSPMTRARSRSVPGIGGCQSVSVTGTAWSRRASASRDTPAVATTGSVSRRPRRGRVDAAHRVLLSSVEGVPGGGGVGQVDRGAGGGQHLGAARAALRVGVGAGERHDDRQRPAVGVARSRARRARHRRARPPGRGARRGRARGRGAGRRRSGRRPRRRSAPCAASGRSSGGRARG